MKLKTKKEINDIFEKIYILFPDTKTELNYSTDFQLLIAVILSAQTTDKQVNKATVDFFKKVKNPKDLVILKQEEVEKYFKSLNFYKNKTRSIIWTAKKLVEDFDSVIPNNIQEIQKLPWVWIKTAKVVLGVLFDAPFIWVDTHIHRICNRIGVCRTKIPEQTDEFLEKNISMKLKKKIHHSLVLFGRYNCVAKKPKCETCILQTQCNFYKN